MSVKNASTNALVYEMYFFYDSYGHLSHLKYFKYTGTDVQQYNYIVLTNSFGDILSLYGTDGEALIHYEYDAWGNVISVKNSSNVEVPYEQYKDTIAHRNPIRYRGYVYDTDTKFYYLQSRYYNPELGRFLNADGLLSTGQGVLGHNMFSYCQNNPVNCSDPTGHISEWLILGIGIALCAIGHYIGSRITSKAGEKALKRAGDSSDDLVSNSATAAKTINSGYSLYKKATKLGEVRKTREEFAYQFSGDCYNYVVTGSLPEAPKNTGPYSVEKYNKLCKEYAPSFKQAITAYSFCDDMGVVEWEHLSQLGKDMCVLNYNETCGKVDLEIGIYYSIQGVLSLL